MDKGRLSKTHPRRERSCDRRTPRLPHYSTPVHKNKNVKWKVKTTMECTPTRIVTLHANRSLSLQDLSPVFKENVSLRRTFICQEEIPGADNMPFVGTPVVTQTKLLAFFAYGRFMKMVWKKRREESKMLQEQLASSNGQAKSLKAQVESLKALLASDEQIISSSFREVQSLKAVLAGLEEKYRLVLEEKEELETTSQKLREDLLKTEAEASNNKNSFILARTEAASLEVQLQKEKDKNVKLKKENKGLLGKIDNLNNTMKGNSVALDCFEQKVAALQEQLKSQLLVLKESHIKAEESDRALEIAERQLEIIHIRMKEDKRAYETILQEEM